MGFTPSALSFDIFSPHNTALCAPDYLGADLALQSNVESIANPTCDVAVNGAVVVDYGLPRLFPGAMHEAISLDEYCHYLSWPGLPQTTNARHLVSATETDFHMAGSLGVDPFQDATRYIDSDPASSRYINMLHHDHQQLANEIQAAYRQHRAKDAELYLHCLWRANQFVREIMPTRILGAP